MPLNVSQRVAHLSALVLRVDPQAPSDVVVAAMQESTGLPAQRWLAAGVKDLPSDPWDARRVAAARVLTAEPHLRSRAVVSFLGADARLPEIERMVPPVPETDITKTGQQLSLLAS